MEAAFIHYLRIENAHLRAAVRTLLADVLENTNSLDFSCFRGNVMAAAFYNPVNREEFDMVASKLKSFMDEHGSILHFAMGMPIQSTRPVESIPGFDWDAVFLTIRGLQTGTDQSYSMATLSSTILSQVGKRDFIKSPRRDTVESDLKHAVGAMLVLQTLKVALAKSLPGKGTSDDPITYYDIFVDRVLRRFHDSSAYDVTPATPTFTAPATTGAEVFTFGCFKDPPTVKSYDKPAELRNHVEKIVHKILFAAAQVLLTDRRFMPDAAQFMKWSQYVVLPIYLARVNPLAAKPFSTTTTSAVFFPHVTSTPPLLSSVTSCSPAIQPAVGSAPVATKLPRLTTSSVGAGVTWDIPSVRPATAIPSPRPRSVTPSKVVLNAAAAVENF